MVIAKLKLRCGIHMVFAKIFRIMKIWTNKSSEYQKWLKSKAHAKWEREHNTISTTCHRVNKLDCVDMCRTVCART